MPDARASGLMASVVEPIGKLLALLVPAAYVAGYLVVNVYLAGLGFHSLGFFERQYLLAGLWALLPMIVGGLLFSFGWVMLNRRLAAAGALTAATPSMNRSKFRKPAGLAQKYVLPVILFLVIVGVPYCAIRGLGVELGPSWLLAVGGSMAIEVFAHPDASKLLSELQKKVPSPPELRIRLSNVVFVLLLLPAYLGLFARFLYPDVPLSLGGGKPARVTLVWEPASVLADPKTMPTDSLDLFLATDKELLVRLEDGRSVALSRDVILAIVFEARR